MFCSFISIFVLFLLFRVILGESLIEVRIEFVQFRFYLRPTRSRVFQLLLPILLIVQNFLA